MGEVVNLRRARKTKAREADAAEAQANRIRHGRTLAERKRDAAEAARVDRQHAGNRIVGDES
jgi:hypothetical protein